MSGPPFLTPDWPAPANVRAAVSLREGGVSRAPFDALNVATHAGDAPEAVAENRRRLRAALGLPAEPSWLAQVHGAQVICLDRPSDAASPGEAPQADAAVTRSPDRVCAIQVADCLPVLFAARDGSAVGAAHAGWRGLAAGVLESTVRALGPDPARLLAWLGPAIGPTHFEVGEEVRAALTAHHPEAGSAFAPNARGRWQCDLYAVARRRLEALGVAQVHGGGWDTFADASRFFSYRRERSCGRMAALIWLAGA